MSKIYKVKVEGNVYEVEVEFISETDAHISQPAQPVQSSPSVPTSAPTAKGEPVTAPMQGNIWKILKKAGDRALFSLSCHLCEMKGNIKD